MMQGVVSLNGKSLLSSARSRWWRKTITLEGKHDMPRGQLGKGILVGNILKVTIRDGKLLI